MAKMSGRVAALVEDGLVRVVNLGSGFHDVTVEGAKAGMVLRDPVGAWSYASWCIQGDTRTTWGGAGGRTKRRLGYRTLGDAVHELLVRQSSMLVAALARRPAGE